MNSPPKVFARFLPNVQTVAVFGIFEGDGLPLRGFGVEGEIIVDKGFAQNGLPAESAFFFKFASRNVGGIQKGFTALRKGEGQEIDFFPQRKIRMESFGIRKGCAGGIENGGAHGKSVAAERIVVCDFVCEWVARRIAVKFAF